MPIFPLVYVVVELIAFIAFARFLGLGMALLSLFALFFLGMGLAWWQMRSLVRRVSAQQDHPGRLTADAALSVVGVVGVALPGLISTLAGILLLLPPTRAVARKLLGVSARRSLERLGGQSFVTVSRFTSADDVTRSAGWGQVIDHRPGENRNEL